MYAPMHICTYVRVYACTYVHMSVKYEITDRHPKSPSGDLTKGKNLEGDWRDWERKRRTRRVMEGRHLDGNGDMTTMPVIS